MINDAQLPLTGIRILDLTRLLPGPLAATHLADMGAEVIKIEEPGAGDAARTLGTVKNEISHFFIAMNRGKSGLRLNLKLAEDREQFLTLAETADVVMESFRPGVMQRLGLGWDVLKQRNPKLVMCAITSYGQQGPLAALAGHDINFIALSGMLAQNTDSEGVPCLPNLQVGDMLGGTQTATQGILAALLAAKLTGKGRFVDISMTDSVFAHNLMPLISVNDCGETRPSSENTLTGGMPCYNVYRTSDNRFMAVGAFEHQFWVRCCDLLGRPDLADKHWTLGQVPGGEEAVHVRQELANLFLKQDLAHWTALFATSDCCVSPILRTEESVTHPHFHARGMIKRAGHATEGEYWATGPAIQFSF